MDEASNTTVSPREVNELTKIRANETVPGHNKSLRAYSETPKGKKMKAKGEQRKEKVDAKKQPDERRAKVKALRMNKASNSSGYIAEKLKTAYERAVLA